MKDLVEGELAGETEAPVYYKSRHNNLESNLGRLSWKPVPNRLCILL
jgi:hypothetical protein